MPSSQIKTCPIKSAKLCAAGNAHAHTLGRKEQWGMLIWRSTALCWQQENTEETLSTHCAHRGNLIFLFPAEDRHHSRTPWTLANSLTAHTNKHNTHLFFLVLLGCFCDECSDQICKVYRTYPNDNQPPIVHRNIAFFSTDDRSDEFTETKCSSITENYGLCTV